MHPSSKTWSPRPAAGPRVLFRSSAAALPCLAALLGLTSASLGCAASTHAAVTSSLGTPSSSEAMEAVIDRPGPISLEVVNSTDWAVPRSGVINLDSAGAKAAGLKDGDEPIAVFAYVLRHPTRGVYLVDSGVTDRLVRDPKGAGVGMLVRWQLHPEKMKVRETADDLVARLGAPLAGVLLTHLHLDHVSGMPAIPRGTPLYAGPGETTDRSVWNWFTQSTIDAFLAGSAPVQTWQYRADPSGRTAGVIDVFGDGSLWAILAPGHTPGSTAYLVRTPTGPVLLTGDASHTRWGWEHDVEPGSFSGDRPRSVASLASLRALAARHPAMTVRLGHQP